MLRRRRRRTVIDLGLEPLESRRLLSVFTVNTTADNGSDTAPTSGSLRAAILASNEATPGPNTIRFAIPASTAANLSVPVSGFDPIDQTWTIKPDGALPAITTPVDIDGFTQANVGTPYNYPDDITDAAQSLTVSGATGGTFTLSTSAPLPVGTTAAISYDASPATVQSALEAIVGVGNVSVSGTSTPGSPTGPLSITFEGIYGGLAIPVLGSDGSGLTGTSPTVQVTAGVTGTSTPTEITSVPNSSQATQGNNAQIRVIVDGSDAGGAAGFTLDGSSTALRGLIITGFGVGVSVAGASDVGNLIQGDFIGDYVVYPVDAASGSPLPSPYGEELIDGGNADEGVVIDGANTTLGGASPQDDVVIAGNGAEGVLLRSGSLGSQVLGCQIGLIGPSDEGVYWIRGNGDAGVVVQSSSDLIGVAGAGNEIAANQGDGVQLDPGTSQIQVAGNYIGVAPGGGVKFGSPAPGNDGDGVDILSAANNTVGGSSSAAANTISANEDDGVSISGAGATGNIVENNFIGTTADGSAEAGNGQDGVFVATSYNQVGPGNVISGNQIGVVVFGASTTGVSVTGNLIGTDATGEFSLGNEDQGVLVDAATNVTISGNGSGSQVISGNNKGIELDDAATGALIEGNYIGTDKAGAVALPNALQGILIDGGAWDISIGGTTTSTRNVISANHWGVVIDGGPPSGPSKDLLEGNLLGTDQTGANPLGNETDGVQIVGSSGDSIGGLAAAQGNTIAFNTDDGIHIVSGVADTIETNSIFSNGLLGIQLDGTSNDDLPAPTVDEALPDSALGATEIQFTPSVAASSTYLIQFFSTPSGVAESGVEGETYIGETTVRTNADGAIIGLATGTTVEVDVTGLVPTGDWITATATLTSTAGSSGLNAGDSSEFSSPPALATNPFLVTSTGDSRTTPGTLAYAILFSNANPSPQASLPNDIQFQLSGVGLQTITLQEALPTVTEPLIIDGYTQPGSGTNDSSQFVTPDTDDDQETDIATIEVQVDGSGIDSPDAMGLVVATPGCTIDGLSLTGFSGAAIFLDLGSSTLGDTVWGNFIGVTQFSPRGFNPVAPATNTDANGVGILIDGSDNLIGGTSPTDRNIIQGNSGDGVIVYGGSQNTIATNFILDNGGDGVLLLSGGNHVGQASGQGLAGAGDLISGNLGNGVHILGPSAEGNTVANDEIGTQVGLAGQEVPILGTQAWPNALSGILIEDAPGNTVGGLVADSGNVTAGNGLDGVTIENLRLGSIPAIVTAPPAIRTTTDGVRNVVEGNLIGVNNRNSLVESIPNQEDGVDVASEGNVVGGDTTAAQNIIAANRRNGITIAGVPLDASDDPIGTITGSTSPAVSNVVAGNFIGTVAGDDDYGNALDGILLEQAGGNTVGGTASGAGNVVSNNGTGIVIAGSLSTANVVEANLVGTTADGTAPMGNTSDGIWIDGAPDNLIGGTTAGAANVIAGSAQGSGVRLSGSGATGNTIEGDDIGTSPGGSTSMGNAADGVHIDGDASDNTIGGTAAGAGDTIADNGGAGVDIASGVGDSILSDSMFANAGTGIVLTGSANDAQAAPTITSAVPLPGETLVSGALTSLPSSSFLIQVFTSTSADPDGSYEGQTLVGSVTVTTDTTGQVAFSLDLPASVAAGTAITATATNLSTGDTSPFSPDTINAASIAFGASQFYASEPTAAAVITLVRDSSVGSATVVYSATAGTAIANVDFAPVTGAITFASGQTTATFSVPIVDTEGRVGSFTVDLALTRPTGAGLGTPATAVLTITASPGSFQFATSATTVPESGGAVTITVDRVGGAAGTATVNYATTPGNAVAGADYIPVAGTLTFPPGVTQESFALPILGNSPNDSDATLGLVLSDPTAGASLGSPASEAVTIDKPLIVTGEALTTGARGITSVVLSFNKPLNPAQAVNLANYGFFVATANTRGLFNGSGITSPLSAASYDPSTWSVTLFPRSPLPLNRIDRLVVDGSAATVLGSGLADASGSILEGSDGVPADPYTVTFGAGATLTYTDNGGNVVTLRLRRGGQMNLFQAPSGAVEQLGLVGTVPGRSTLTGSLKRGPGSTGRIALPPISGASGVHVRLKGRALVAPAEARAARPFARRAWHR